MSERTYHVDGSQPGPNQIFVFGSNLSGIHGGGAALAAYQRYGAEWGFAEGRTSRCYAIPTVKARIAGPLPLVRISAAVERFLAYAAAHADTQFFVTRVGCGLAGHLDQDVAPMFKSAPVNCSLPSAWLEWTGP